MNTVYIRYRNPTGIVNGEDEETIRQHLIYELASNLVNLHMKKVEEGNLIIYSLRITYEDLNEEGELK